LLNFNKMRNKIIKFSRKQVNSNFSNQCSKKAIMFTQIIQSMF